MHNIKAALTKIRTNMSQASEEAKRNLNEITLVAISKRHGLEKIKAAISAGHMEFGENKVQEAEEKWLKLKNEKPSISLHLVGVLQSNKVRAAINLFDVIHTLDRLKLASRLADVMSQTGLQRDCFIQVNTGAEPQKSGILPQDADNFIRECRSKMGLPIVGLMCIPPVKDEPSLHFSLLRKIADRNGLSNLSMGMSSDYKVAIQFGATHIRVGTDIFGERII